MPRIARAVASGFPHHVVQRGNNREKVFFDKEDRERYLTFLNKYSDRWDSPLLAYCLMNNHIHLLVRPKKDNNMGCVPNYPPKLDSATNIVPVDG